MISRAPLEKQVKTAIARNPVTVLLGPRQCGKTTLARGIAESEKAAAYFDLEDAATLASLAEPKTALDPFTGLIIIDEVQRRPDLFPVLRVLADRVRLPARFLILGSASPDLLRQTSESLAGRVEFVEMSGFNLAETGSQSVSKLWLRGGFPRSFLAANESNSIAWREQFIRTFLERDLPQLGLKLPALALRRFWHLIAHFHGQIWNSSVIGRALNLSDVTARRYLDLLAGAYLLTLLPPWFENLGKRQVKAPKAFVRDSGLLHCLLDVRDRMDLLRHPKQSASWEGFALEQVLRQVSTRERYFWATHAGAELDLLLLSRSRRWGVEFKLADAPAMTKSMHVAMSDLKLDQLWVIYPGDRRYGLHRDVEALPLADALKEIVAHGL